MELLALFVLLAGFIIGLGAVTVIDIHGFLGRHSAYWTEATIRTHKVTKPLIWAGLFLVIIGGGGFYWGTPLSAKIFLQILLLLALIVNGCFLTFWVSPRLIERERVGQATRLLPLNWQRAITVSFVVSFLGWWGSLLLLIRDLL